MARRLKQCLGCKAWFRPKKDTQECCDRSCTNWVKYRRVHKVPEEHWKYQRYEGVGNVASA